MTNERKELLKEKIKAAYDALHALSLEIKTEDAEWADKFLDQGDEVAVFVDDEELALEIVNLADNLRDFSNYFIFE